MTAEFSRHYESMDFTRMELILQSYVAMSFNCSLHAMYSSGLYLSQSTNYHIKLIA